MSNYPLGRLSEAELQEEIQFLKKTGKYNKPASWSSEKYEKWVRNLAELSIYHLRVFFAYFVTIILVNGFIVFIEWGHIGWSKIWLITSRAFIVFFIVWAIMWFWIRYLKNKRQKADF
jgi:hypothetical protein